MLWSGYKAAVILAGNHQDDMARLSREMTVMDAVLRCKGLDTYTEASLEFLQEQLMEDGLGFEDIDLMMVHVSERERRKVYSDIAPKVGIFVHMPSILDEDYDTEVPQWEAIMGGRPYGKFGGCYMFLKKREGLVTDLNMAVDYFMQELTAKRSGRRGP